MKKPLIYICIGICVLGAIYASYSMFMAKPEVPTKIIQIDSEKKEGANMANPASIFCKEKGGKFTPMVKPDGSQYAICMFDDNKGCEEWAMFRGECPVGGIRVTGYDSIDQEFCAWSGGKTSAVKNSQCKLMSGKICPTIDFYNGTCKQ